jgi:hypothetical protein
MELNLRKMMTTLQSEDGVKNLLMDSNGGASFADLIADSINIQRMDNKRLAQEHGVDLEIKRMSPERAGDILQAGVKGNPEPLVEVFNELEDQREQILREAVDSEEEVDEFREKKKKLLFSQAHGDDELKQDINDIEEMEEQTQENEEPEISDGEAPETEN